MVDCLLLLRSDGKLGTVAKLLCEHVVEQMLGLGKERELGFSDDFWILDCNFLA